MFTARAKVSPGKKKREKRERRDELKRWVNRDDE